MSVASTMTGPLDKGAYLRDEAGYVLCHAALYFLEPKEYSRNQKSPKRGLFSILLGSRFPLAEVLGARSDPCDWMKGSTMQCSSGIISRTDRKSLICLCVCCSLSILDPRMPHEPDPGQKKTGDVETKEEEVEVEVLFVGPTSPEYVLRLTSYRADQATWSPSLAHQLCNQLCQ